jgi:hypothetical protein
VPSETSLREICGVAGVPFEEPAPVPGVLARRSSSADAVLRVASFAGRGESVASMLARAAFESGRVTLVLEGSHVTADGRPERLLDLPHDTPDAEALFLARAAVEADGGRLELTESAGRLVARFSWPAAERKGAP